ncbi:hypothetical protein EK904_006556 [Melospiza melodia maxima]|nr:hypothetical protein EK904_006556 [Melospiza melodia maxima]
MKFCSGAVPVHGLNVRVPPALVSCPELEANTLFICSGELQKVPELWWERHSPGEGNRSSLKQMPSDHSLCGISELNNVRYARWGGNLDMAMQQIPLGPAAAQALDRIRWGISSHLHLIHLVLFFLKTTATGFFQLKPSDQQLTGLQDLVSMLRIAKKNRAFCYFLSNSMQSLNIKESHVSSLSSVDCQQSQDIIWKSLLTRTRQPDSTCAKAPEEFKLINEDYITKDCKPFGAEIPSSSSFLSHSVECVDSAQQIIATSKGGKKSELAHKDSHLEHYSKVRIQEAPSQNKVQFKPLNNIKF